MAKRKAAKPVGIPVSRKIVEYEDGGIYPREKIVGEETTIMPVEKFVAALQAATDFDERLAADLNQIAKLAAAIVGPCARLETGGPDSTLEPRRSYQALDLGDGRRLYSFPGTLPERVKVALDALHTINAIRLGDTSAVYETFRLGRLAERLYAMQFEPDALKGKQQAQRARTAGKTRELLKPEQQRKAAEEIAALVAKGNDIEPACKSLMPKYGVSLSTLKALLQAVNRLIERKNRVQPFD